MLGLVDYADGSDSEDDSPQQPKIELKKATLKKKPQLDEDFFAAYGANDDVETESGPGSLNLPSANSHGRSVNELPEGDLEGVVKPRDWELKLAQKAEKEKKKLKKAHKKEKKEKKKKREKAEEPASSHVKKPEKKKIAAFGALASIAQDSESEDEDTPKPSVSLHVQSSGTGLLSMLPTPKSSGKSTTLNIGGNKQTAKPSLVQPSLRNKSTVQAAPIVAPGPSKRKADSDDSDDDNISDAFGFSTSEPKYPRMETAGIPMIPASGLNAAVGPSLPQQSDYVHPSDMYSEITDEAMPMQGPTKGVISDAMAFRMLSRDESIFMKDRRSLTDIAGSIVDVNVDQALGPNVSSNLLKNVTKRTIMKESLPVVPKSKNPVDKRAKDKHQITYLANLAKSREEALEEQWSANRVKKRMAREKYGF